MPEMVAPRALVFRPLVEGNEALGTRLARGKPRGRDRELWPNPIYMSPYMKYLPLRFPVPLDKGNGGSGKEIEYEFASVLTLRMRSFP